MSVPIIVCIAFIAGIAVIVFFGARITQEIRHARSEIAAVVESLGKRLEPK